MKHDWCKTSNGSIDQFAIEDNYHNGVICKRCGQAYCIHCFPNYDETECDVGSKKMRGWYK